MPASPMTTVRLRPELDRAFRARCVELGVTRSAVLVRFVEHWTEYGRAEFVLLPPDLFLPMAELASAYLREHGIAADADAEVAPAEDASPARAPLPREVKDRARARSAAVAVAAAGAGS